MTNARTTDFALTQLSDTELQITRTFEAPRDLVFRVVTDPAAIPQCWGLRAMTTTVDEMDVRPGGRWRFVSRDADGNEYAFRGEYREVVAPERIVQTFEFEGMPGAISLETMTLEERDGRTLVTAHSRYDSAEACAAHVDSGMEGGARETYDRLAVYLERVA